MAHEAYDKVWEDGKAFFEKQTGKHKPKESKGIFNAFGSHTGLSGSLTAAEEAYKLLEKTTDREVEKGKKAVASFSAAIDKFLKAKKSYLTVLEKAIYDEFAKRENPNAKSDYEKALKFLVKTLDALEANMAAALKSNTQKYDEAAKEMSVTEKMLDNWEKNIRGALARASAGIAKVKSNPTAEEYNKLFPTTARDITMQLVFARKLDGFLADPQVIQGPLDAWANAGAGGYRGVLQEGATKEEVIANLKDFSTACKKAAQLVDTRKS